MAPLTKIQSASSISPRFAKRAGQEYRAADDAVCADQCMDGAKTFAECPVMSASAQRARARQRPESPEIQLECSEI
jgi:hypothetical protein